MFELNKICVHVHVALVNPVIQFTLVPYRCNSVRQKHVAQIVVIHILSVKRMIRMVKLCHTVSLIHPLIVHYTTVNVTVVKQVFFHVHRSLLVIAQRIHVIQVHAVFHVLDSIQINAHRILLDRQVVHALVLLLQQQRQRQQHQQQLVQVLGLC
jgi:hypothetical protein